MTTDGYDSSHTALLLVDPYNDFLSEGGKLWPHAKQVAESVRLLDHMRQVLAATRAAGIRTFFVPHRRTAPGDYADWAHLSGSQAATAKAKIFEKGSWGGTFHPDFQPRQGEILVHEHWSASGFANTDLDLLLKQHGISRIVLIGMRANTCIDTTARFGQELGYHVTLVKDAIASFRPEEMHATFELNAPTYAHALLTTDEFVKALPQNPA
ncbi:isochorismatase hydrolase [Streptomyces davaonensis JCM 4913]|uniref:Isochorismatase hydrolase n=1 Tax=Streptomyces davaonensis (strain DSM 101723 / JCM 4913 / KCC S-0913 / 768) TaxID=1214101 RepID=K4QV00_STRDJ|nr:isochorismatase family cysteine hydrolase [Streptomyces davaonensis]CCK24747.1 isochorismatase hydrolase [Streptomyces davaonensis JCM 4913]